MYGAVLKEFNEQMNKMKEKLYDAMVRNNNADQPGNLDSLHRYEELLRKILFYWKRLYHNGAVSGYTLRMPSEELQKIFDEKTSWYIHNILKSSDMDVRIHGIGLVERNCETEPNNLSNTL